MPIEGFAVSEHDTLSRAASLTLAAVTSPSVTVGKSVADILDILPVPRARLRLCRLDRRVQAVSAPRHHRHVLTAEEGDWTCNLGDIRRCKDADPPRTGKRIAWWHTAASWKIAKSLQDPPAATAELARISYGGPYRDRTDDIHGVNVTLYQLS
jgi:hypothetical protein